MDLIHEVMVTLTLKPPSRRDREIHSYCDILM